MNAEQVREALNGIVDPCSAAAGAPAGLVDMGLVRSVAIDDGPAGARVTVTLAVTEPGCLMAVAFATSAKKAVAALPGVERCEVRLDHDFQWSPEHQSEAYQATLAAKRPVSFVRVRS